MLSLLLMTAVVAGGHPSVSSRPTLFSHTAMETLHLCQWQYDADDPAVVTRRILYVKGKMSRADFLRLDEECQLWLLGRAQQLLESSPR